MSPEQAAGRLDELGPASDVYSLGAMLYNLLTGGVPFDGSDLGEILGKVRAGDFPAPRQVNRSVPPALEAVCMKAMAREPGARYASPRELADDVEHWLADEPVAAWHEPLSVRARRWMRRHRTAVTAAVAATLAGLIAVAAVQGRLNRELKTAYGKVSEALDAETRAKKGKEEALAQSDEARKRAEAVLRFLKDDVLAAARPEGQMGGLGRGVTVRQAIDAAEPRVTAAFKGQPIVEAELRNTLGQTYLYLGDAPLAVRELERAVELRNSQLGATDVQTLDSRNNLAIAYEKSGRLDDAIRIHEETLRLREARLGPNHPVTLQSRSNLAIAYEQAGRTAEALRMKEDVLRKEEARLGPNHPVTLLSRNNLAIAYEQAGRTAEAILMHEDVLRRLESKAGPEHPDTLSSRNNLAAAYGRAGRISEAIRLFETTLKRREAKLGPDHFNTLLSRSNLAAAYESVGRRADAEPLRRDTLARRRKLEKPDSSLLAGDLTLLGVDLLGQSKWSAAEPILRECLAIREKVIPDAWQRFNTMSQLGEALVGQGRYAEAEPLIVGGYEGMKVREFKIPSTSRPRLLEAAKRIVHLYDAWGRPEQAAAWKLKLGLADLPADVFASP